MKDTPFTADRLLALYDQVAEAEDAIPRLRRFVLDLAVRGKLVEQDPSDEPAAELLKRIAIERYARVKSGEIRKGKPNERIDAGPWDTPSRWAWLPLGDTGNIFTGNSIDAATRERLENTTEGRPFIATKDVGYGLDPIAYENGLLVSTLDSSFKVARANSVLICAEGGSAGRKIGLTDREVCFGNKLLANETWSVVSPRYVLFVYQSRAFYEQFVRQMTGVIGGISINKFLQLPFPLPPLAEQRRIVAKVDELMALCDRIEGARAAREAVRDRLAVATWARLTAPETESETFPTHARAALQTLPALTNRPDQIKALRQTILNLAVRGKLVEHDPAEGRGDDVIAAIATYKSVRRSTRADSTLIDFDPPDNWALHSLDTITLDGPKNGLSPTRTEDQTAPKAITLTATTSGQFDGRHFKHVNVTYEEAEPFWLEPDDLLFQRGNTPEYVGMAAIYDGRAKEYLYPDLIMRVRIVKEMDLRFVHLWCISPVGRAYLMANATGAQKTMPKINQGILKALPIMIPPLAEQHRIVARVDALMALCDQLEASLTTATTSRSRLLEALLHEALGAAPGDQSEVAA